MSSFISQVYAQCDINNPYDKITSSFHSSIALKSDGSYSVWGQLMNKNGTSDVLAPQDINSTNYPGLTGTVLRASVGGFVNTGNNLNGTYFTQGIALTTTGLFAWGTEGSVISTGLTTSSTFQKITAPIGGDVNTGLPTGVNPSDVSMLIAADRTLVILTNTGSVWILSLVSNEITANGITGTPSTNQAKTWFKAKTAAGVDLANVKAVRLQVSNVNYNAIMALTNTGTIYTWGKTTYLGNNTGVTSKNYATLMTLPNEFSSSNIPKMIAVTGGSGYDPDETSGVKNTLFVLSNSGALYSLGDNSNKQIGDFTTTERLSWVNAERVNGTNFSNVNSISVQEHDGSWPGVAIVTKTGDLYTWGNNSGLMIGRNDQNTLYDPGFPNGFTSGTDKALSVEIGGHTTVYLKEGSTQFCYVGHKVGGSMGDGSNANTNESTFNCTGTPSLSICGSVPVAGSITTSTIIANPTSITANGTSTTTITVQLKRANGVNLTSTGGNVVITTNKGTISNVTDNNDGTYTAILTSSTFVETATLNYTLNGVIGANSASVNFTAAINPVLTTTGTLKTFTSCSGCTVSPQSFTVSGVDLSTNNIVVTAPTGFQVSTNVNSGFATSINIVPTAGTVTTTTIYAKLTNNATSVASGVISVTSTGAAAKTITVTTNTDNALLLDGVGDYVNLGDVLDNNNLANTTEAWVYWKGSSEAFSEIFTKDVVQSFSITSGNKLHANFGNGSNWISGLNSTTSVPLNTWTHLAVTRSNTGVVKMYINGVLDASTNTMNVIGDNAAVRGIGVKIVNGNNFGLFTGAIDNLKVWNVEKSITDIVNGMYTELAGNETDLLAYYDFNQGIAKGTNTSITSLIDKGPSGFNGTIAGVSLTGTTSNFVDGFIPEIKPFVNANANNNALSFGGANDYVVSDVNGTALTSFTIEAFINPANTTGTKGILQWAPANDPTSGIPMVLFQQYNGTGLAVFVNGAYGLNTTLPANSWSHVAVVYANSLYTLYVNGSSVATYSGGNQYQSNSTKLYLGTGYPQPWNGLIDEVRIWNTARSASEIFNNMYIDLSGAESGLMAYYNMNQGNANASNSGTLTDKTSNANNGTFTGFSLTGTNSNFIPGNSQIGSSVTIMAGTTYQLANALSGGTWASSNTSFATVNSSTGVVTAIATGAVSITYTICGKSVAYPLTVYTPSLSTTSLKTFTTCSGCTVTPQSFSVSGSNLGANVLVTAPSGFEVSNASAGTYSTTLVLSPSLFASSPVNVYARLINTATTASNGNFTVASTGAASKTVTATVNTDNALNFDGVNDIISTANNIAALNITGNITVETWIRLNQMPTDYVRLIGKGSPTERTYGLWLYSDGSLLWQQYTTASNINNLVTNASILPVGKWCHIAVTKTGSNIKIYINGNEVATSSAFSGTPNSSTAPLEIGGSPSIHSLLNGMMDEVRIWNVGRTASQIANSYLSELVGDGNSNETGLVAYYNFNQGIAGGTNSSISVIEDRTSNGISATLNNFAKTGSTSNFVSGSIPDITAVGNVTTVLAGGTLALSNGLTGGVWSSTNTNIASINTTTGLVTGVAAGIATMSYTICNKVVTYGLTVLAPSITTGTLKTFTSCSGCTIPAQTFTVAGTNLGANVVVTAPSGFEVSNASAGTYSATLSLTPSAGTLATTNVYARLINTATTASNGNFTIASTGAASKTVTATVNTDNALNFDGVNDHIVLDNIGSNTNFAFTGTANFTLEAWVNRKANASTAAILSKFNGGVAGNYWLSINSSGTVSFSREADPWSVNSNNILPLNEWHHIAGVFDGSNMKLYIDGVLNNSVAATASVGSNVSALKVYIGAANQNSGLNYFFKGSLDEIRVWNLARTASEIQNSYAAELQGNESGLVAYYNFNQGAANSTNSSITSLTDRTSNALNGTITNMPLTGTSSNFVTGRISEISGNSILNKGFTTTYTNALSAGTWTSSNSNIASVNSTTGLVTGVNVGNATITYTICEKTVSKLVTVVVPTINKTGSLTTFNTCLGTASAAQTFTVSAQYLTANLTVTAPTGYEISTDGSTYTSTLTIVPTSGTVSARLIYVRLSSASVNGQSGNIAMTSTDAVTQNIATGNATVTRIVAASVVISSNATNNSICAGSNILFTATPTNGGNAPTYQWKLNGNNITGANSATYSTTALANNDVISVLMGSSLTSCVTGTPSASNSITTTVTAIPAAPGNINGSAIICMNSNQVYSIGAVTGATSYTWVVTGDLTAVPSTTNVLNITSANNVGSGTIKVLATNGCGSSVYSNIFNVTVSNQPAPTANFTVSANNACLTSAGITFTSTSTPNATTNSPIGIYSWTFGDGTFASTATASNTFSTAGNFDVILSIEDANQCRSSISSRIVVDPLSVAGTASVLNSTICEGTSTVLTLSGNTGTIQWQVSNDGINFANINGATSINYTTPNLTATRYYQAVVTSGACSSSTSGVVTVTVSPTPSITLSSVASIYTTATSFDLVYNNPIGAPDEFSISSVAPNALPNFNSITNFGLTSSPVSINIPASSSGTYNFNLTVKNGNYGCVSAVIPFTVTVASAPPAGLIYNTPNVYTKGTTITPLNPTSTGGIISQYSIGPSLPAGLTMNPTTGIISGTPSAVSTQTTYIVTGTNASGTITSTLDITVLIDAPASLSYTSPNVYTTGTSITPLNPTSTGGAISQFSITPILPAGLSINSTTGIISGTPTATSSQTTYTVTGTNVSGTISATVVITVNSGVVPQPQASLNAVDYGLLSRDTVKLKLTTTNGTAPYTLILSNSANTLKDTISNLTPVNNVVEFLQKRLDTTKVFTIFKLIDANNNTRTTGFTKDTTIVRLLKPQILLTLKADPAVKQENNSFKTRLILKIKNAGQLNLRNVQVNANLSTVFPSNITYILDSVRVLSGGLVLNPNYNGAGSATSASSTEMISEASLNSSKASYAVLDGNYLFNAGTSMNQSEEAEVAFYVSIGATTRNVVLKLQFETAGDGVLVKNDGSTSEQETTSTSDDGTNFAQHPSLTNQGLPLPTYVPLFPNESIGGSLNVGSAIPVTGGFKFHFTAKVKNYGNVNLDSIRIQYNFNEIFPSPDQASIIGTPTITRGNIVYNATNFDGYTNVNMFNYGGDLQVGDSATYEYDLMVATARAAYTWPNYFVAYGRSVNSGVFVNDTSMAGIDPDPNADNDPIEQFYSGVTISYNKPAPPIVENKIYTYGATKPANISGLVKSTPTGTVPVWCNTRTAACSLIAPTTPTEIGRYIYALRSYDTTTLLYSEVLVYDTVIIRPSVPMVVNKKYIIGESTNPTNISGQVTGMTGSTLNYFKNAGLLTAIPALGIVPGVTRYTTSQTVNNIESDTVGFTVTMLDPKAMLHLQKIAEEPRLQSNSTFNITYTFFVSNTTDEPMSNVLVVDNLQNTFPLPMTYNKFNLSSTGGLITNAGFNGSSDINLVTGASVLKALAIDTIRLTINIQPKGYKGTVNNVAVISAKTSYGVISMNSSSQSFANETAKTPTPSVIPDLTIDIPEAFSPNRDGVNDRFVILKPFGTTLDLEVYNRWGNVVYSNGNYNNEWDGRGTNNFIGQDLMDGGYYYTLKAKSANGNIQIFKGFLLIQR